MKKLVSLLLALCLVLGCVSAASAAGSLLDWLNEQQQAESAEAPAEEAAEEPAEAAEEAAEEPAEEAAEEAAASADVIDFEDGAFAFVGLSMAKGNADKSELSVEDCHDGKALKVAAQGKVPYVAFNLDGLLGENLANVRAISVDFGLDPAEDGKFYAASGNIFTYTGADLVETGHGWSVYMEKKNPRTVIAKLGDDEVFTAGAGNFMVISKEVDNAQSAGLAPVGLCLDNIKFLDADGNALPVDLSAEYVAEESGRDLSNLVALKDVVEFPGFTTSAGAWAQNGYEMPQEIVDALVPGSVVEIEYQSADGAIWLVMPWAQAGWMRVGGCGNGVDAVNNSHNIAQVPYEMIEQFCGEDKSTWGAMMQCEGSSDWEVYALRVGQRVNQIVLKNAVEFPGFATSGAAWSQNGFEMPQEIVDALVPGSVVEISYTSADGDIWLVMPWASAGWMRISQGSALKVGGKAYITYEEIEALCGEDKSTWGAMMQCEGSSDWEVYSIRVGQKGEFYGLTNLVNFEGFTTSGAAWSQNGFEMPQEIVDALVPGSVVTINYESADGNIWLVMPWASAGWMRVGNDGAAVCDGKTAQITYEMIEALCGEDKSTWGAMMQCEGSSDWQVYSLAIGTAMK